MIQQIELLQPLYDDEYVEGVSVVSLPVPHVTESVYITTGNTVHAVDIKYLRVVDIDSTGIYEWYLYSKHDTYVTMYGVYHDTRQQPVLLMNKHGMCDFMTEYSVQSDDEILPVTSKHLIDYYLSTISDEVYGGMMDEHDFGRDNSTLPRYMCRDNSSISQIAIELNQLKDSYGDILRWFDTKSIYPYSPTGMKSLIHKSVSAVMDITYSHKLSTLFDNMSEWLNDRTVDRRNILSKYLSDGYLTKNELKKMANHKNANLSRSNMCHDVSKYHNRYLRNLDTSITHDVIKLVAISPVREFYFHLGANGAISDLSVNDIYGYGRGLLVRYFNVLAAKLAHKYPLMNVKFFKTWDNQFIVVPGNGASGIEVCDITTSIMACSEFVHVS